MNTANITIYMNRKCTSCGTKGATVYGLCIQCTHKELNKEKIDPRTLVDTWVKRGVTHTIEHYVTRLENGFLQFACGKFVQVGKVAPGTGTNNSIYQCASCNEVIGTKNLEYTNG